MLMDEIRICRTALRQFISDAQFGFQFDPEIYAKDLRENGFLNYFLNRLLHSYDTLMERQRIFLEWFPEFGAPGIRFLSDCIRRTNLLSADFLDSCLFEAEKQSATNVLQSFLKETPLSHSEMILICGQLLSKEIISRGDFDRIKTCLESRSPPIFVDVVSNGGISGIQCFSEFLSSNSAFEDAFNFLRALARDVKRPEILKTGQHLTHRPKALDSTPSSDLFSPVVANSSEESNDSKNTSASSSGTRKSSRSVEQRELADEGMMDPRGSVFTQGTSVQSVSVPWSPTERDFP